MTMDDVMPGPQIAPFPYFGGKRRAAPLVWQALGAVRSYVEPFAGSAACLLARPVDTYARPEWPGVETINDASGMVANFWRAVRGAPDAVTAACDYPVSELDLHARHRWLVARVPDLRVALEADPEYFDAKAAGWWAWGASQWIGTGWCPEDGGAVHTKLPDIGHDAVGVRKLSAQLPHLSTSGCGTARRGRVSGGVTGETIDHDSLDAWLRALSGRLRGVRVACGDWKRIATPAVLWPTSEPKDHVCGVFLDPPYSDDVRRGMRYAVDCSSLSAATREWCAANGNNPRLRIVLAGESGEHDALQSLGWRVVPWKRKGGYSGGEDRHDERLWFSPFCVEQPPRQPSLFDLGGGAK